MKKFLIGQLACFGDCLYVTALAKQIKKDFPDSHITWAISSRYKPAIELNPDIDAIWELKIEDKDYYDKNWDIFEAEAKRKKEEGEFDEIYLTQIPNQNWHRFDGTIRSSLLNVYPKKIDVSVSPVICLSQKEVENVSNFINQNNISSYQHIILFEYAPGSGQSFVDFDFALEVSEYILENYKNVCFIFSSQNDISNVNSHIKDASKLSFRENAELLKYCTLLIGCSSGITWLSTSEWTNKKINTLQLLTQKSSLYAGLCHEHTLWNLPTQHIIELVDCDTNKVKNCLKKIFDKNFENAKNEFHQDLKPSYQNYRETLLASMRKKANKTYTKLHQYIVQYHKQNKHLSFLELYLIMLKARKKKIYKIVFFITYPYKILSKIFKK